MRVRDLLHILGRFIYNICTIKQMFMWSILIIFGVFRKNREIPNSMSCTDKNRVLFLESISTLIIKTESEQF